MQAVEILNYNKSKLLVKFNVTPTSKVEQIFESFYILKFQGANISMILLSGLLLASCIASINNQRYKWQDSELFTS